MTDDLNELIALVYIANAQYHHSQYLLDEKNETISFTDAEYDAMMRKVRSLIDPEWEIPFHDLEHPVYANVDVDKVLKRFKIPSPEQAKFINQNLNFMTKFIHYDLSNKDSFLTRSMQDTPQKITLQEFKKALSILPKSKNLRFMNWLISDSFDGISDNLNRVSPFDFQNAFENICKKIKDDLTATQKWHIQKSVPEIKQIIISVAEQKWRDFIWNVIGTFNCYSKKHGFCLTTKEHYNKMVEIFNLLWADGDIDLERFDLDAIEIDEEECVDVKAMGTFEAYFEEFFETREFGEACPLPNIPFNSVLYYKDQDLALKGVTFNF